MATGRRITVHEAQIKTAAIEVKALVLNSRQITLSVFRQLKKETLVCLYRGAFEVGVGRIRPFAPEDLACFEQHAALLVEAYAEQWADPEQVYDGMLAAEKEVEDRIKAWRKQYDALAALDQLFIAV